MHRLIDSKFNTMKTVEDAFIRQGDDINYFPLLIYCPGYHPDMYIVAFRDCG